MKVLKIAILLLLASCVFAQVPPAVTINAGGLTATGAQTVFAAPATVTQWQLFWTIDGTVTTCQVKLEQATSRAGAYSDLIAAQTCTANGSSAITAASNNFVRVNLTTLTGGGTVYVYAIGYSAWGAGVGGGITVGGLGAVGAAPVGNPVLMGLKDGAGNVQAVLGNTLGNLMVAGAGPSGSAVVGNPLLIAGSDGANARTIVTDAGGDLITQLRVLVNASGGLVWGAGITQMPTSQTLTARNSVSVVQSVKPSMWSVTSSPAVSTLASASIANEASVRHVADCVSFSGGSTTAPAATQLKVTLRDGASGAGTIIWQKVVIVLAATGQNVPPFSQCGLNLVGTTNTAMTLEWSSLLTNLFEEATLTGYNIN